MNGVLAKQRMLQRNLSPESLAAAIGCSLSTVHNMFRSCRVRDKFAYKAAEILEVDIRLLAPWAVPKGPRRERRAG